MKTIRCFCCFSDFVMSTKFLWFFGFCKFTVPENTESNSCNQKPLVLTQRENLNFIDSLNFRFCKTLKLKFEWNLSRACYIFLSRSILKKLGINVVCWKLNVSKNHHKLLFIVTSVSMLQSSSPHNASSDKAVLDAQHVRILLGICDTDVCELNIEVLIYAVQCSWYAKIKENSIKIAKF